MSKILYGKIFVFAYLGFLQNLASSLHTNYAKTDTVGLCLISEIVPYNFPQCVKVGCISQQRKVSLYEKRYLL